MKKRLTTILILCMVLIGMLPTQAFAREWVETEAKSSLTVQYPVSDITFSLYRVGDFNKGGELSWNAKAASYGVSIDQEDQDGWGSAANALAGYITRDGVTADYTATTDASGKAVFSDLPVGLYLLNWEGHISDGYVYTPQPSLLTLPSLNPDDSWNYQVQANAKYDREKEPETTTVRVRKVWENDDKSKRPASIEVQLINGSDVQDTVTLSEENNWTHQWENLDAKANWQVVEKAVPDGYTVSVTKEGTTILVTNTGKTVPPTPTPPTPSKGSKLPQTGLLWWPVPVMMIVGLLAILIGIIMKRHEEQA